MAATGEVISEIKLYDSGDQVTGLEISTTQDATTSFATDISVAMSAVDQVIPVDNKGTIKELRIFTDYTATAQITCKINSQSTAHTVNPVAIFTEPITALTVSNSNTTTAAVVSVEFISV